MHQAGSGGDTAKSPIDQQALAGWLGSRLAPGGAVRITGLRVPSSGYSALTVLVDVAVTEAGETRMRPLVLRLEKPGQHVFLDTDIARQGEMMMALGRLGVPVPRVVGIESDTRLLGGKFLVVDRSEGVSLPQSPNYHVAGLLTELDDKGRRHLWDDALSTIARINQLDWRNGFRFLDKPQYGPPGLGQYLGWLEAWKREAMAGEADPVIDRALARLMSEQPLNPHVNVLWGDSNPGNFLFNPRGDVVAALDFEASALGPAEIDIAWWFFMDEMLSHGQPRQPGLPTRDQQLALYEAILGRRVSDLDYFELLAATRIALVIARTGNVLIRAGRLPASNRVAHHNPAVLLLAMKLGIVPEDMGDHFAEFSRVMNDR